MNTDTATDWPAAGIDPVRRLRVIAAAKPHAAYGERIIQASFDDVWAIASDLEHELPALLPDVRSFVYAPQSSSPSSSASPSSYGGRQADARGYAGLRARFDVVLRPGWCLMQSRFLLGGMAAVPEGEEQTRFAFLGSLRFPGWPVIGLVVRPFRGPIVRAVFRRLERRIAETRSARP